MVNSLCKATSNPGELQSGAKWFGVLLLNLGLEKGHSPNRLSSKNIDRLHYAKEKFHEHPFLDGVGEERVHESVSVFQTVGRTGSAILAGSLPWVVRSHS